MNIMLNFDEKNKKGLIIKIDCKRTHSEPDLLKNDEKLCEKKDTKIKDIGKIVIDLKEDSDNKLQYDIQILKPQSNPHREIELSFAKVSLDDLPQTSHTATKYQEMRQMMNHAHFKELGSAKKGLLDLESAKKPQSPRNEVGRAANSIESRLLPKRDFAEFKMGAFTPRRSFGGKDGDENRDFNSRGIGKAVTGETYNKFEILHGL
jgi:hypothetical protein